MNVTGSIRTILCAGVSHLVLPRSATKLLAGSGEGTLVVRRKVRLKVRLKPRERRRAEKVVGREPV